MKGMRSVLVVEDEEQLESAALGRRSPGSRLLMLGVRVEALGRVLLC